MERIRGCAKACGPRLILPGLLVIAFCLRAYGLDWDRGLLFHPDERQILMVVDRLALPGDWRELLHPSSPLNPRFFAYGSFPLYLLRLTSSLLALVDPGWLSMSRYYLLGRVISAVFDTLTVLAAYGLGSKAFDRRVGLLTAAFLTFAVLNIQMSHFFTVDTLLTMIVLLAVSKAMDVAKRGSLGDGGKLGLLLGAGLATKFSVLPLAGVAVLAWVAWAWPEAAEIGSVRARLRAVFSKVRRPVMLTLGTGLVTFLILEPYALLDICSFVRGVGQEMAMSQGWYDFPYTRQYAGTQPYLYVARQIVLFALGIPLGLAGIGGMLWLLYDTCRRPSWDRAVLLAWPVVYGGLQGASYAKFLRYALPLLPFLCLAGAATWVAAWDRVHGRARDLCAVRCRRAVLTAVLGVVLVSTIFYGLAFLNVYRQPHTWIQASEWICERITAGAVILTEAWDDPLPSRGGASCPDGLMYVQLDMYVDDTSAKTAALVDAIASADWIVLSSQRLYGPITRLAARYPISSRYYAALFGGRLGYQLVAAPAVYPQLGGVTFLDDPRRGLPLEVPALIAATRPTGLILNLGRADESLTVYDHPQPLVFARVERLTREALLQLLAP